MGKMLARFLFVSSCLVCQLAWAAPQARHFLKQEQLQEPALVSAWLEKHAASADRKRAALAYDDGLAAARQHDLSGAVKSFGESAIRLPAPDALNAYADALILSIAGLREYRKDRAEHQEADLLTFEGVYRSALASDDIMRTLSAPARQQTIDNAECIADFRRNRTVLANCRPLARYGLRSKVPD